MGRPKLPDAEKMGIITMRLTGHDRARLKQYAEANGLSVCKAAAGLTVLALGMDDFQRTAVAASNRVRAAEAELAQAREQARQLSYTAEPRAAEAA